MEILSEILRFVTFGDSQMKSLTGVKGQSSSQSLSDKYIWGLANGRYSSDDDAAGELYGTNNKDQRFRTLKSRTFDRLIYKLLFLDLKQRNTSEYLQNYFKCSRYLLGAQILTRLASMRAGYIVAQKTLTTAERFEFTDLCLPLSVLLRDTAALWEDLPLFTALSGKVKKYSSLLSSELEAEYLLDEAGFQSKFTRLTQTQLENKHQAICTRLEEMNSVDSSYSLRLNCARARILYYEVSKQFGEMRRVCLDTLSFLQSQPHLAHRARMGEFQLRLLEADVITRQKDESDNEDTDCLSLFREAGVNWYSAQNLIFVKHIHRLEYDKAYEVYSCVVNHRSYHLTGDNVKERWSLNEVFLILCARLNLWEPPTASFGNFRLSRFLNSMPLESKSKQGSNILILVFETMYLLLSQKYEQAESRIQYLNVYCTRYLREEGHIRVQMFIKALQYVPRYRGNAAALETAVAPYITMIREAATVPMPGEINELLPYDVILESYVRLLEEVAYTNV